MLGGEPDLGLDMVIATVAQQQLAKQAADAPHFVPVVSVGEI